MVNVLGMLSLANVYNLGLLGRDRALFFAEAKAGAKQTKAIMGKIYTGIILFSLTY